MSEEQNNKGVDQEASQNDEFDMALSEAKPVEKSLIVVGIGASAGGLEALTQMLSNMPENTGMSFVLAQHLSPSYRSMLVDLLQKDSKIKVVSARNGEPLYADTLYICPPSYNIEISQMDTITLTLTNDNLHLPRPSVDMLFESIAIAKQERAIGIILSGTGSDGARGIRAIKGEGGFGIVQEPSSAKYDGMPNSAINSGNVDLILSPEEIGPELKNIASFPKKRLIAFESELSSEHYLTILEQLRKHYNVDFRQYKKTTVTRRIERRLTALKIKSVIDYVEYLKKSEIESEVLFNDMLIGVTAFFRDGSAFNRLKEEVRSYIKRNNSKSLRVWVPGCSTGEEAYSLAILISEVLGKQLDNYKVQIFATDIDKQAVSFARNGVYPESALYNLPDAIRRKYFTVSGEAFQVIKPLKSLVIFSVQDVTVDPPFLRLDMISCRNLLIYFNLELQRKVLPIFHYALNPKGLLFLGQSESIGMFQEAFRAVSSGAKIYEANFVGQKVVPNLSTRNVSSFDLEINSISENHMIKQEKRVSSPKKNEENMRSFIVKKLEEVLLPFTLLINDNMDIVFTHGKNPLVTRPEGIPSNNIFKNLHPNLTLDLRSGLHQLEVEKKTVSTGFQKVEVGDDILWVRMLLSKGDFMPGMGELVMIFFQVEDEMDLPLANVTEQSEDDILSREQKRQLMKAKEQLQTVIEELETSNEEMQSLNEELQSSNEELQSSNEELETTNEELQSTNEELQTAYAELKVAYDDRANQQQQLETLTEELENRNKLLKEAEQLGRNGSFRWNLKNDAMDWSDGVYFLFGVKDDYKPTYEAFIGMAYREDRQLIEDYLDRLLTRQNVQPISFRIQPKNGRMSWLKLDATVYYDKLKQAEEVMATLTDMTEQVMAEKTIHSNARMRQQIISASLAGMFGVDWEAKRVKFVNNAFSSMLGYSMRDFDEMTGTSLWKMFHSDDVDIIKQHYQALQTMESGSVRALTFRIKSKVTGNYVRLYATDMLFVEEMENVTSKYILSSVFASDDQDLNYKYYQSLVNAPADD